MTLDAGTLIYKSVNPQYYMQGEEFETSTYNYGTAVTNRSGRERAEFDQFMKESKATGQKLGGFLEPALALPRFGTEFEGRKYVAAFREHFVERVRAAVNPMAPRRREVVFAGLEKSHVEKYRELAQPTLSILVTLEVIRCDASFSGDMAVLDEFEVVEHDYNQARNIVERYWLGCRAPDPCLELLVQGRFKWGAPV